MKQIIIPRSASTLIVEDSIARRHWFLSRFRLPEAFVADRPKAAIRILKHYEMNAVFLDFDLAPGITSEPIARFLIDTKHLAEIFITSQNPFGCEVLRRIVPKAKIARFGEFDIVRANRL